MCFLRLLLELYFYITDLCFRKCADERNVASDLPPALPSCLSCQRCLQFDQDCTVWNAKQQIICSLGESLWDAYNYGLFQPAGDGGDAKFLEEERLLRDYAQSFEKGVPYLEVGRTAAGF